MASDPDEELRAAAITGLALELRAAAEVGRLDRAALTIAELDDAPVDRRAVLAALDDWGAAVQAAGGGDRYAGMDALTRLLGRDLGFTGDRDTYDHPDNSFLPKVLARRRGLPITLSILYLEVARRAELPLFGIALPGHFVVGYRVGDGVTVTDPFAGGALCARADLEALVARAGGRFHPAMLSPATPVEIVARVLRNLLGSYQRRHRLAAAGAVAALWAGFAPDDRSAAAAVAEVAEAEAAAARLN